MLADKAPEPKHQTGNGRIVILDIERLKGQAAVEFWSLGDFKNRRIHADDVVSWPRTILVCWNVYGEKKIHAAAEWDDGGHYGMLKRVWEAIDNADAIVGHNVGRFDLRNLRTEMAEAGMKPPRPVKIIDTLTIARREFAFESNTLDAIATRFNVTRKSDKYSAEVAQAAIDGSKTDQRRITSYCRGDVVTSREVWLAMQGWNPAHPHIGPHTDELNCNQCGSTNLTRNGTTRAIAIDYGLWRCDDCGANIRAGWEHRATRTRGAR